MKFFKMSILLMMLAASLLITTASAGAATGVNYLGDICLVLDVGPRMLKLGIVSNGSDHFSVTGKLTDGLHHQPLHGSGILTNQNSVTNVTITLNTSNTYENISSVFTLILDSPLFDYGYYTELYNSRVPALGTSSEVFTEIRQGDFAVNDCANLKL